MPLSYELNLLLGEMPAPELRRKLAEEKTATVFVNDDYKTMSNSMVRYFTGPHIHPASKLKDPNETDEEFLKWLS